MTQMFMWPNATTTFPHAQQTPLTGQQGNLLFTKIITWLAHEPGMGLKVPINNPIQTRRRASLSSSEYSIRGCARTNTLLGLQCTTENTQKKRNTPAKYETTIDETLPTTSYRNLYPSRRAWDQQYYQKKLMYTDYIQPLRNINKLAGK